MIGTRGYSRLSKHRCEHQTVGLSGFWELPGTLPNARRLKSLLDKTIKSIAEVLRNERGAPIKVMGVIQDITEQKQSLRKKEKLEQALIQARKMESIGSLAGGIAHEFNNILSIIIGTNELVAEELPKWSLARESTEEIRIARDAGPGRNQTTSHLQQPGQQRQKAH